MNDVKLQEGLQPIDKHLRPIKVGDEISALEISTEDVRVSGDIAVDGSVNTETINSESDITLNAVNDVNIPVNVGLTFGDDGEKIEGNGLDLTISSSRHLTLDTAGTIFLDSAIGIFEFYDDGDTDDAFKITVAGGTGATTLETVSDAADGHLTLDPDGDLLVSGADVKMDATKKLYLDGGGDTYISEISADRMTISVGGDGILDIIEDTTGNKITAKDACIGFDQAIYSNSANIFFNDEGNKAELTLTADITNLRMYFPNNTCNCVLVIKQDGTGSHAVTNWISMDQSDGNQATIYWAGGTAPTVTTAANSIDIISFYWDNDGHKCYGVASQAFAQP